MTVTLTPAVGAPGTCTADGEGIWLCQVGPVVASFQVYTVTATTSGQQPIALSNVLFGDVWVCCARCGGMAC